MPSEVIALLGLAALVALLLARVPIGLALIAVAVAGIWTLLGTRPAMGLLVSVPYDFVAKWTLSSVPMFLLMGYVCYHAGLTKGLFDLARIYFSRLPGGLAIASVFGSAGFAAVCGSSVASCAAMGRIAIPEMLTRKYDPALSTGTIAAAGTLGALIPPSIILILFGIFAEVPIGKLFLGGISVGLLTTASYVLVIWLQVKRNPSLAPQDETVIGPEERRRAVAGSLPTLAMAVVVLGGLFSGFFTATEAGAVGALAAVGISACTGRLNKQLLVQSAYDTLSTTSGLFVIAIGANLLTRFLSLSGATDAIGAFILGFGSSELLILVGIAVVYLLLGMFLEPIGAMLLTLPVFLPILSHFDTNLVWFGVFVAKLLEVGMITPPIGLNVFVVKGVTPPSVTLGDIFRGIFPFLFADALVLSAILLWPGLITSVVDLLS